MIYRTLGNNGALVSVIGMGCEGFEGKTEKECEHLFSCAANQGINFFDLYTPNPRTRQYFGKAMKKHPEKQFILQGHLCTVWKDGQYSRTRNMQKVQSSFEALLSDLQLGCIDVGMIHYVDGQQDFDMVMGGAVLAYAKQLQKDGVIRSIGLSTHNPDIALLAVQSGCIDVIMFSINPAYDMLPPDEDVNILFEEGTFDRVYEGIDPKRDMLYRLCQNQGVALTVMKPFAGGLLLDSGQSPFGRAATPVQCISYCLDRPAVASVMGGMTSDAEIEAAVQYCTAGEEERDYSEILSGAPKSAFHGHCMYCGHCAPCTVHIDIAAVNKYLDLAMAQGAVPETVREHYAILTHHAGECIACGACMKNCPFGTDIIEKMKQAKSLFGK